MTNDIHNINTEFIQNVIDDYDAISESQEFPYPSTIKKRIKKLYDTKLSLPSSLSVDIIEIECKNECWLSLTAPPLTGRGAGGGLVLCGAQPDPRSRRKQQ